MAHIRSIFFNHLPLIKDRKSKRVELIAKVIKSGLYFDGPQNKILEAKLLRMLMKKRAPGLRRGYITTLASGHDALLFALSALKLKKDDEIIFPVNSYPTAFPAALSGATLVACDVDENGQIDIDKFLKKITKKTRAAIIVHLYGLTTDVARIKTICQDKKIAMIEDCAQSLGSRFKGQFLGSYGTISCFSFYPTKNLGGLGDGGAIWTNNKSHYNYFLKAKSYGEEVRYDSEFIAGHSRLPEIQAAILNYYTLTLSKAFKKRKSLYQLYQKELKSLAPHVRVLVSHANSDPVPHILVIDAEKRDRLAVYLKKKNIPILIHYPKPVHLVKAFSFLGGEIGDFPMAEKLSKRILSLPFHPNLREKDVSYICDTIKAFYGN